MLKNQFLGFSRISKFPIDISRNLTLVKFSEIHRLVESGKLLRCGVNTNKNLKLIDFNKLPKF